MRVTSMHGSGTLRWQSPELINATQGADAVSHITDKCDVYAFGCLCIEVFSGRVPFHGLPDGAVVLSVGVRHEVPQYPGPEAEARGLNSRIWGIMQDCWKTNPTDRPTMAMVADRLEE